MLRIAYADKENDGGDDDRNKISCPLRNKVSVIFVL